MPNRIHSVVAVDGVSYRQQDSSSNCVCQLAMLALSILGRYPG